MFKLFESINQFKYELQQAYKTHLAVGTNGGLTTAFQVILFALSFFIAVLLIENEERLVSRALLCYCRQSQKAVVENSSRCCEFQASLRHILYFQLEKTTVFIVYIIFCLRKQWRKSVDARSQLIPDTRQHRNDFMCKV